MIFIKDWHKSILRVDECTIEDAIRSLELSRSKIVLAIDQTGKLIGTITDGDIRRATLKGFVLTEPIETVINKFPLTATSSDTTETISNIMNDNGIDHLPLVDEKFNVLGLIRRNDAAIPNLASANMVIMAGGLGKRLGNLTKDTPKALMKVGDLSLIEKIILKAKNESINRITISVNYLADQIIERLGNGSKYGVDLDYVKEDKALGTGGALQKISFSEEIPILVTNCDVVSNISYSDIINFHNSKAADVTMALRQHVIQNEFGVVELGSMGEIISFREKPSHVSLINAGIYVINSSFSSFIETNESVDMPTVVGRIMVENGKVYGFPLFERWLDVGRADDLNYVNNNLHLF